MCFYAVTSDKDVNYCINVLFKNIDQLRHLSPLKLSMILSWKQETGSPAKLFSTLNPALTVPKPIKSYMGMGWIINAIGSLRKDILPINYPLTEHILREGRKLKRFCTPDNVSLHMRFYLKSFELSLDRPSYFGASSSTGWACWNLPEMVE